MDANSKDYYFVRAHVWPSMRTELLHNVSVVLSNLSGAVIHAFCEPCKVPALDSCSHVVAVLLFVLDQLKNMVIRLQWPVQANRACGKRVLQ